MRKVGIIHVHSTFSHDGENTLEEIAIFTKKLGYNFVGITEHSDTFDSVKMNDLVKECKRLTDDDLIIIPGIEFTCDINLHLIGLGIERFTNVKDALYLSKFIREQGGIAIVAHPRRYHYKIPKGLATEIDGIEVWNVPYDGRFVPNVHSIKLWKSLKYTNKFLVAFGGQDFHRITEYSHIKTVLSSDNELKKDLILKDLKNGNFKVINDYFTIDPINGPGKSSYAKMHLAWRVYQSLKRFRDYCKPVVSNIIRIIKKSNNVSNPNW